jgi:hypothetical protein
MLREGEEGEADQDNLGAPQSDQVRLAYLFEEAGYQTNCQEDRKKSVHR